MEFLSRLPGILNLRKDRRSFGSNSTRSPDDIECLKVRDLTVDFVDSNRRTVRAVDGVTFTVKLGETLGILGESGSGKTTIMLAILGLLGPAAQVVRGSCQCGNFELIGADYRSMQRIRGARIGFVFQEPSLALHPTMRVQDQVAEVIRAHPLTRRGSLKADSFAALEAIFQRDTSRIARAYPHQLSGGQQQRVLIAQGLACHPQFLFADELTASLDSCTQQEILDLLQERRRNSNLGMLIVSHNPAVLACLADRILVIKEGKVVENGPVREIFNAPRHPYTKQLLRFVSEIETDARDRETFPSAGLRSSGAAEPLVPYAVQSGPARR